MIIIAFLSNWEQYITWAVLLLVLYSITSGKMRYDLTAFGGLLFLGALGLRSPSALFSGFSSPALFTIATVLVMSAGIVESGVLSGLGKAIAEKFKKPQQQILAIFLSTGFLSAFMNNVGSIGIILPTAKRMAIRAGVPQSAFGLPIVYASILGGSMTLIGTASNLIVSSYRLNAFGEPFKMFDFALHGIAIFASGILIVFLCRLCGFGPIGQPTQQRVGKNTENAEPDLEKTVPRDRKKSLIVLAVLVPAVVATAIGAVHPSIGFGVVVLLWLLGSVFSYETAIKNVNIPIIIFLGSMFGISGVLEETGALAVAVDLVRPVFTVLPPFFLILTFLFVTAIFANVIDNSISAVLMAPVAIVLWNTGAVPFSADALLMAVAAGSSLAVIMPTHQATIVVLNSMIFPRKTFMLTGAAIMILAGLAAAFIIYRVWY